MGKKLDKKRKEAIAEIKALDSIKRKEISKLLEEKEERESYVDIFQEGDSFGYGFKLGGKDAIILDNQTILRNTLEKVDKGWIGENEIKKLFKYKGNLGDIAPLISRETIKKFYEKDKRKKLVNSKEIYDKVRKEILYYMDFGEQEEITDVLTCWTIATYCYPLFYWFPHILFNAPSSSGKSKAGKIIQELSFRGFELGSSGGVSPAQIFRTLEGNRGTMLIDEFEISNVKDDTQRLVNQILNASAYRDSFVIRAEKVGVTWKSFKFPIFCPKIVCNITGINTTSLSRFIAFKWLKTSTIKGSRKPYTKVNKERFKPIREELYLFMLENWNKIKEIYDILDISSLTKNREEDNWLPLFAIAEFFGEEVKEKLTKYLMNYKELEIQTGDDTEEFFAILLEKAGDKQYISPKKIVDNAIEIAELFSSLKAPQNKVGKILSSFKFESRRYSGRKEYLISEEKVKRIIDLYFPNITTPNNTNTTNATNVTKAHKELKKAK
ncbi:hypothetical protein HN865_01535 [Candidatus Woesearchaeota archaeon]|nr:hypothetical protein [Candidatus Woesearchaeota archaeon]MBT7237519.1 hypothetical protein [Candidatus Woesearchaeota archaeon]